MNKISDYDFRRISSFIDGELDHDQIVLLMTDMKNDKKLKETYFSLIEISEATSKIQNLGVKQKLRNLSLKSLLRSFFQRLILPGGVFAAGVFLSYSVITNVLDEENNTIESTNLISQAISSVEAKRTLENVQNEEILKFASRHFAPITQSNSTMLPVSFRPNWIPSGFKSDPEMNNKYINSLKRKQFSIFINNNNPSALPDGEYIKENFILIKKTHRNGNQLQTITIFGDIDIESGKKILNSIQPR